MCWREPGPSPIRSASRAALQNGPACPQPRGPSLVGGGDVGPVEEDCLTPNVFALTRVAAGQRLPAMVWLHGGALVPGSGGLPIYKGTVLAAQAAKLTLAPSVLVGDRALRATIVQPFQQGRQSAVPLLIGSNGDEAGVAAAFGVDSARLLDQLGRAKLLVETLHPGVTDMALLLQPPLCRCSHSAWRRGTRRRGALRARQV